MTAEPLPTPSRAAKPPVIPGYEIGGVIGRGATGTVFHARQRAVDREVAIKVLHPQHSSQPRLVHRLQREARTTARLAHPHVVSAIDMGETDGAWWYVMEYVDGPSLAQRLKQEGRITWREALRLFIPLCEALEHLCEHGVVHRDIKPANILIDRTSGARLADLGLAFADDDPSVTGQGGTLGTPHYISPEQAVNPTSADTRSDIWSFGATLFNAVCGRPPFAGESAAEILSNVLYARVPDPTELEPSLPKGLALILRKCLTREPEGRYQTPRELLLDLERVRERRAPKVRRSLLDPVQRHDDHRRLFVSLAAIVALISMAVFFYFGPLAGTRSETSEAAGTGLEPHAALEDLWLRFQASPERLAQHRAELEDLVAGLPPAHEARWNEIDRALHQALFETVRGINNQLRAEVGRALGEGRYAAAHEALESAHEERLFEATGYRRDELEAIVMTMGPFLEEERRRVDEAIAGASRRLEDDLGQWSRRRREEVDRLLDRHDWNPALALLLDDPEAVLREAGSAADLPRNILMGLARDVVTELSMKRQDVKSSWEALDRRLLNFVGARRRSLETELRRGRPRPRAARDLEESFQHELAKEGLTEEEMPRSFARTSILARDDGVRALARLEEELLEDDARADFAETATLVKPNWGARRYSVVRRLWQELADWLAGLSSRSDGEWREDLARRVQQRLEEARLLEGLLLRVADRIIALDGEVFPNMRVGSITYPKRRIDSGLDPLEDGFHLEGVHSTVYLKKPSGAVGEGSAHMLDSRQLEELGGFGAPAELDPDERLVLALFRFHEGRYEEARSALNSGPLPTDDVAAAIASEALARVLDSVEQEAADEEQRLTEARLHLAQIEDVAKQARMPQNVLRRIRVVLDEYGDLPEVRRRASELRTLKARLEQKTAPQQEDVLRSRYDPTELSFPSRDRVRMAFDLDGARAGAWQRGDWTSDAAGWIVADRVESWAGLRAQRGPTLQLHPPVQFDSFDVTIEFEQADEGRPRLFLVSAGGFHVALCGAGLPGTERRPRYLIGSGDLDSFIRRLEAGEGERDDDLLVPGKRHALQLEGYRPAGHLKVRLDGRLLKDVAMLAPKEDAKVEVRSWEIVRLKRAVIVAGR